MDTYSLVKHHGAIHWFFRFITSAGPDLPTNSLHQSNADDQSCCIIGLIPSGYCYTSSVSVSNQMVVPNQCTIRFVVWICQSAADCYESKAFTVFEQSYVHSTGWTGPKRVCRQSVLETKAVHSPNSQWKTRRPTPCPKPLLKQSVNRSVIQYQLSSPSTRCQSLVLCWWVVRRCCSGGVLASSQAYCSEAPGKNPAQQRWAGISPTPTKHLPLERDNRGCFQ